MQTKDSKCCLYETLTKQICSLIASESDPIANMANIVAVIKEMFGFWWVGFYIVRNKTNHTVIESIKQDGNNVNQELVLGPFQGPVACTRIASGKGVCGTAWLKRDTIIVDDVEKFDGHIACSSASKSEIVIPVFKYVKDGHDLGANKDVWGVLDIDSDRIGTFDRTDAAYLKQITELFAKTL